MHFSLTVGSKLEVEKVPQHMNTWLSVPWLSTLHHKTVVAFSAVKQIHSPLIPGDIRSAEVTACYRKSPVNSVMVFTFIPRCQCVDVHPYSLSMLKASTSLWTSMIYLCICESDVVPYRLFPTCLRLLASWYRSFANLYVAFEVPALLQLRLTKIVHAELICNLHY